MAQWAGPDRPRPLRRPGIATLRHATQAMAEPRRFVQIRYGAVLRKRDARSVPEA